MKLRGKLKNLSQADIFVLVVSILIGSSLFSLLLPEKNNWFCSNSECNITNVIFNV